MGFQEPALNEIPEFSNDALMRTDPTVEEIELMKELHGKKKRFTRIGARGIARMKNVEPSTVYSEIWNQGFPAVLAKTRAALKRQKEQETQESQGSGESTTTTWGERVREMLVERQTNPPTEDPAAKFAEAQRKLQEDTDKLAQDRVRLEEEHANRVAAFQDLKRVEEEKLGNREREVQEQEQELQRIRSV